LPLQYHLKTGLPDCQAISIFFGGPAGGCRHEPPCGGCAGLAEAYPSAAGHTMASGADDKAEDRSRAAANLLPEVYAELRRLAAALMGQLAPGQTLEPTALVHEAYLRLVRSRDPGWEGRRHFFGAAARAMREILIEQARRKASAKHGGKGQRVELGEGVVWIEPPADDLLALDEAVTRLQAEEPRLAEIVLLRYYTGLTVEETAGVVGESDRTVSRDWRRARAWLARHLAGGEPPDRAEEPQ
jgi:RNA polymerase sigma factor (TIGR02999 family)